MDYVNTAKLRQQHPNHWGKFVREIKENAPDFIAMFQDPFLKECIEHFDATVELRLEDIPECARPHIPQDVITKH